ncbi:MAG: pseudaminic acid synthase [bacterium]
MRIADRMIGVGHPCFVIAEISANHHQQFDKAAELVRAAKRCGADAVKLQTYTPDTMTIDCDSEPFIVRNPSNPSDWKGRTLYSLYQGAYTPWEWHAPLKALADEIEIPLFSSPFDDTAVALLEEIGVPAFKVASYEVTHRPLLKTIAATGKPVIMSVGFASEEEIAQALHVLRTNGAGAIALLHCVTSYSDDPDPSDVHLANIAALHETFGVVTGFSDNNFGVEIPIAAMMAGAHILEKHFIMGREEGGADARFSLTPDEFSGMVRSIRRLEAMVGVPKFGPLCDAEAGNVRYRRSIFVVEDIAAGDRFTVENVRVIRPAGGLPPSEWENVLGKKAATSLKRGTPLESNHVID